MKDERQGRVGNTSRNDHVDCVLTALDLYENIKIQIIEMSSFLTAFSDSYLPHHPVHVLSAIFHALIYRLLLEEKFFWDTWECSYVHHRDLSLSHAGRRLSAAWVTHGLGWLFVADEAADG